MDFEDKTLKCVECGSEFVFSADEQKFYQEKGLRNEPKRCLTCRQTKRQQRHSFNRGGSGGGMGGGMGGGRRFNTEKIQSEIVCAACGQKATVPFKPTQNKPVYCNECFAKTKGNPQEGSF
jgi:CxxC-x17-CxxC domain-containing protein